MDDAGVFDARATYARIRKNRDALDNCPRHSFDAFPLEGIRIGAKLKCNKCGGEMALTQVGEYVRGYVAAGRNGNDILPGWQPKPEQPTTGPIPRKFFGQGDE